jgi:hypothetical protein
VLSKRASGGRLRFGRLRPHRTFRREVKAISCCDARTHDVKKLSEVPNWPLGSDYAEQASPRIDNTSSSTLFGASIIGQDHTADVPADAIVEHLGCRFRGKHVQVRLRGGS